MSFKSWHICKIDKKKSRNIFAFILFLFRVMGFSLGNIVWCAIYDNINDSIILSELYSEDVLEYTFSEWVLLRRCTRVHIFWMSFT
jgi:hypothetical protein